MITTRCTRTPHLQQYLFLLILCINISTIYLWFAAVQQQMLSKTTAMFTYIHLHGLTYSIHYNSAPFLRKFLEIRWKNVELPVSKTRELVTFSSALLAWYGPKPRQPPDNYVNI